MRKSRLLLAATLALGSGPASAIDVTFAGTVLDTCIIALATPGVMGLSNDATILGTDQGIGVPALVTVVSLGSNQLDLAEPELTGHPGGVYTPGDAELYIATSGLATEGLSLGPLEIDIGLLPLTNLFVDLQIVDPTGFSTGLYTARTVLTCS